MPVILVQMNNKLLNGVSAKAEPPIKKSLTPASTLLNEHSIFNTASFYWTDNLLVTKFNAKHLLWAANDKVNITFTKADFSTF